LALASSSDVLLLTCGVDRQTSLEGISLAQESMGVRAFVGVHPSEVLKESDLGWLPGALESASGLGEVGLDPKYSSIGPRGAQVRAFHAQLEAADRSRKPVQVHSRDAEGECIDTLGTFRLRSVLFHWFQDEGRLGRVQDSGYFVSFGPSLVYSKKLQRMAMNSQRGLVLTETDSPVAYGPLGGASGPSLIPSVLFKLAELWKVTFGEAAQAVSQNTSRYLGASEKG
jgi:TatD DNase family protein